MRKLLFVTLALVMAGCAHKPVATSYGTKGTPQTIPMLVVAVTDEGDNSELKGNDFLRRDIENAIIAELTAKGYKCIPASPDVTDKKPSHLLVVASKGMKKSTYVAPVQSTPNYVTGGTNVTGGGSYTSTSVHAIAVLYLIEPSTKIAQAYAGGDGQGFFERQINSTVFSSGKPLSESYHAIFLQAALGVFE